MHILLFTYMEWSSSNIQPTKVFHLVNRILEGKTFSYYQIVAQATSNLPTMEDPEECLDGRRGLRWRPLRILTQMPWMAKSQPHLIIHQPL